MAKQNHPIDQLFRDKLGEHEEKPSAWAWEKLDAKLHRKDRKGGFPWFRIAASLLVVGTLAYVVWTNIPAKEEAGPLIGHNDPKDAPMNNEVEESQVVPDSLPQKESLEEGNNTTKEEAEEDIQKDELHKDSSAPHPNVRLNTQKVVEKPAATLTSREPVQPIESEPKVETAPLDTLSQIIAEPEMDLLVAESEVEEEEGQKGEAVAYRVQIISSGISEKPKKEPLAKEIEQTINKLGGLLGKVDQGYADLQDAKNNLLSSLITKEDHP